MRVILRPTKAADLSAVIAEALPYRIKALTAVLTDASGNETKILGIGGLAFPPNEPPWAFVQQAPEAKNYPKAFHKAGLAAMQMIQESGLPEVFANCPLDDITAGRWLARLGFRIAEFQPVENQLIWTWRKPV